MTRWGLIAALVTLSGAFLTLGLLRTENAQLHADNAALRGKLETCGARLNNILEDKESDDAIDGIDLGDFGLPDHWLRQDD